MYKSLLLIPFLLFCNTLFSQSKDLLNQEVSPKGGVNYLAAQYLGIEFSKEQRNKLKGLEIELIFMIDTVGNPTLTEVNGIVDPVIIDSLKNKTKFINSFNPHIRDGIPIEILYFLKIQYPSYPSGIRLHYNNPFTEASLSDFETVRYGSSIFSVGAGPTLNQFLGTPSDYLKTGLGFKMDLSIIDKRKIIYGLNMSVFSNKSKKDYPLNTNREQIKTPTSLHVGIILGKRFGKFAVQSEFNIAVQNVTEKLSDDDPDWEQLKGWSPGLLIHYPIEIGDKHVVDYGGSPTLLVHHINLHFGFRYLFLSLNEASGLMMEIGVNYKFDLRNIISYKLKDNFLEKQ